ncbi:DUF3995 domain-containing protein [Cytobacillus depressus]|uniref:DUF3995 domain-containing protein n=1 Tax=Cytobacillus depressus TaxID=1602942 RepID=A0A6L3V2W1_9BACI|nr:DUF3995 domain-containing protein [Cytobacillus depressus]KAB2331133.1 DUF3995 domain-containing protein [Cytobacillus depressus]
MTNTKANDPKLLNPQLQQSRTRSLVWSGYAVFIWSIVYMIPHLYWALGGTAGLTILKPSILALPQWELVNWVASVILTLAGLLGIALIYFWNRKPLKWLLLTIALAGSSVAASHGIYGIVYRLLQITGVIGVELDPFNVNEHAYVLWDLLLFEPWFLIEGILLVVLGWYSFNKPNNRRIWFMLCTLGIIIGIVTGLLGVRFA